MIGMRRSGRYTAAFLAGMVLAAVPGPAFPETPNGTGAGERVDFRPVQVKLFDIPLRDQDGNSVRFRTDAIGDRIVVVDTFFTSCGLICPILGAIFMDLQGMAGDRLGKDIALLSISVDPLTDIPPRLKAYATKWEARPGWVFLTGGKQDVDRVLSGLGLFAADFSDHPAAILVGDGRTGEWTRFNGFATPEQLMERIEALSAKRAAGGKTP